MTELPVEEIQQIARRIAESEGLELVDLEFKQGPSRGLLRVFIDRENGITLEDCETVSRQLSAILDVKDLLKNAYVLEVSSPGVDRPLVTDRDYRRSMGRLLNVRYLNDAGVSEELLGTLVSFQAGSIVIEQGGKNREIARSSIQKAVQELVMAHPKKGEKRRK